MAKLWAEVRLEWTSFWCKPFSLFLVPANFWLLSFQSQPQPFFLREAWLHLLQISCLTWRRGEWSILFACMLQSNKNRYDTAEIRIWRHFHWSWPCNSMKVDIKFHLECKLRFPFAQLLLRQIHLTNLSVSIDAKCWAQGGLGKNLCLLAPFLHCSFNPRSGSHSDESSLCSVNRTGAERGRTKSRSKKATDCVSFMRLLQRPWNL